MNITGNARYQFTEEIIEKAVLNLLKRRNYNDFTVKDICNEAGINRSSFYAHYEDINDFMIKFEGKLGKKMHAIWQPVESVLPFNQSTFITFFTFITEYKVFYKAFLKSHIPSFNAPDMLKKQRELFKKSIYERKLKYSEAEMDYHLVYFGGGLKALCGWWIQNDCKETPEQMAKIIYDEYTNNAKIQKDL